VPIAPLVDRPTETVGATTYLRPSNFSDDVVGVFGRAVAQVATLRFLGSGSMDATAVAQGTIGVSFQHSVPDWDRLPGEAILRSLGGERREVEAGGVTWNVMGLPTPVRDVAAALAG
jgi:myo-inositol-1(or 4)-monophosphatase